MSESLGGYSILGELGHGAMGVVYHAMDPRIGRAVAIKRIRVDAGATPEQAAMLRHRLVREASAAGNLSHPNIVAVYHLGEEGPDVFIVMEYVAGQSLERALLSNSLDLGGKLEVLRQTADALDFAHRFGIVHRDIKPANILLREDGVVKIADFGIAKMTQQITMTDNLTTIGSSLGSPAYMSPEQVRATQLDGRSDQFSLAVIAFEMVAGRLPFSAETAHALMFQIISADPLATQAVPLPPAVGAVLNQALAKDPQNRFPSCTAMVQALKAAIEQPQYQISQTQIATPPVPSQPKKSSAGIMFGLLALLLLFASGGGYLWWKNRTPPGQREAPLVKAIQTGSLEEVKRLIAKGQDVNDADGDGTTPLMAASEGNAYLGNYAPVVTMLIDKGANIDAEDKQGRTALFRAAANGKPESIQLLLAKKADPNHKSSDGSTPLIQAIYYGHAAVLPVLIAGGAQIELEDSHRTRPLMQAAEGTPYLANNTPLVATLLQSGAALDAQDDRGRTALYRAAAEGREQAVRLLLQKKANLDLQANDGTTALLAAVTYGKVASARALVESGANVETGDSNGATPLMIAAEGTAYIADGEQLVTMLLAGGAKVDVQDQRGRTALHRASASGKSVAQQLLIDKKANVNLRANDGTSPLSESVTNGKLESAKLLLTRGANPDTADGNGTTPLMIAAEGTPYIQEPEKFVALLLASKARKDLTDTRGRTALVRAEEAKKTQTIELLKSK